MRNSKLDSKYFVKSLDYFGIPCQNPQKPPQKLCNLFTLWFPKELVGHNFHTLQSQNRAAFTSLPFQGYCELEGPVQTTYGYDHA